MADYDLGNISSDVLIAELRKRNYKGTLSKASEGGIISASIETITPLQAQAMLEFNSHNRKLKPNAIKKFSNFMKEDKWKLNGESIIFYEDGELADGQNRLNAVVKSGVTIQSVVVRGIEKNNGKNIDSGTGRTAGDVLYIDKINNSSTIASGIKYYLSLHNDIAVLSASTCINIPSLTSIKNVEYTEYSNSGISEKYEEHPEEWQLIGNFANRMYLKLKICNKSEIIGVYAFLYFDKGVDSNTIETFFKELFSYSVNCQFLNNLRDKLINNRISTGIKINYKTLRMMKRKAWNAYYSGKKLKQITYDANKEGNIEFLPKID